MIVSKQKKRTKLLKRIGAISAISITVIAALLSYNNFSVEKNIIVSEHNIIHKQQHNENDIETNTIENNDDIRKLKQELDEANKFYTKKLELKEDRVRFVIEDDLISLYVTRGTLKDVLYAFVEQFDLDLNDYTDTFEDLTARKSFYLTGSLDALVNDVLKKYGYDNFVINTNIDSSGMKLVSVYLLEPPLNIEESSETKAVIASVDNDATINPIMKRLKQQAIPVSSANINASSSVNGSAGVNNDLALAKRELDASQNVITFNAGVDFSNGVPEEFQPQLQQLTQSVTNDAQGLVNALANAEAQLKANQFLNGQ